MLALGLEIAQAFWSILLPHGFDGGALTGKGDDDTNGWQKEYNRWWSDFLTQKGGRGVSKDTWIMVSISKNCYANFVTVILLATGLHTRD